MLTLDTSTVDGHKWLRQRKTASNLFSMRGLRESMAAVVQENVLTLHEIFQRAMDSGEPLDLFHLFNRFTFEVISEIAFGIKFDGLGTDVEHPVETAFNYAQQRLFTRFLEPSWLWKTQRWLNVGDEREFRKQVQIIDDTCYSIISRSIAAWQGNCSAIGDNEAATASTKVQKSDIISLFLDGASDNDSKLGEQIDPKYLRDIVVTFMTAGRDTTAAALSWFFYILNQHPETEKKIREEMASKLPELVSGGIPSPSMLQVNELVNLEAALKETLRLYPAVPSNIREALQDVILCDGTVVEAGEAVSWSSYSMGRMPHVWGSDAKVFKPERWIDTTTGKLIAVSPFKFTLFSAGPRVCLGAKLAMMEMKIAAASVLSKYHLVVLTTMSSSFKQKKSKTLATRKKTRKRRMEEGMTFEDGSGRLFQPPSTRDPRWKKPTADAIVANISKNKRRKLESNKNTSDDDEIEIVQQDSGDEDEDLSEEEVDDDGGDEANSAMDALPKTPLRLCSSLDDIAVKVAAKHAEIRRKDGRQKTKVLLLVDARSVFKALKRKMNIRQEMVKPKSRLGVGSGKKPELAYRNTGLVKTPLDRFKDVNKTVLTGYKSGKLSTVLAEDLSFYPYTDLKVQHVVFVAKNAVSAINLDRSLLKDIKVDSFVIDDKSATGPKFRLPKQVPTYGSVALDDDSYDYDGDSNDLIYAGQVAGRYDTRWTRTFDFVFLVGMILFAGALSGLTTLLQPELWSNSSFWFFLLPKVLVMMGVSTLGGIICRFFCIVDDAGYVITERSSVFKVNYTRKFQLLAAYLVPLLVKPDEESCAPIRERSTLFMLQFNSLDRPEDRPHTLKWIVAGNVFPGLFVLLFFRWLFARTTQSDLVFILVFVTSIGDGLAEPVGIAFGKHKYSTSTCCSKRKYTRSFEGSACVFLSGIIFPALQYYDFDTSMQLWLTMIILPFVVAYAEATAPHTMDAPVLMAATGLVLYTIIHLF
ncbi:hypothetical protein JM18_006532 [Phytophthora kernoviae]|uniref:Uncharacterized protein n=2 Tax=Phytophthora kernoviae TaxID=325452 RepID=A0A921SEV9_9STRA|nr:hypothetical protein G195_007468 [Phytophthora kernoviae 00238/432]KAG2521530.1 hypothetical protein JM18_006532 [Phytophthora kernoviae]